MRQQSCKKSDILKEKIHLNKIALYTSPIVCGLQGANKKRKPCIIFRVSEVLVLYITSVMYMCLYKALY